MEAMNFTLEGLDELIESAEKMKKDASQAKMGNFTSIVKGVARKYTSKWVDREDLEQDLWVRVLTLINDCGGIENVDESLVARVCYNKAVDSYRYSRRRYEANCQFIEGSAFDGDDDEEGGKDNGLDYFDSIYNSLPSAQNILFFKEVIDLFPKDSKERKYVILKLVTYGVVDISFLDASDREIYEIPEGDTEADYIKCLGYKSHCPGSWTCKKRDLEKVIKEFLR